MKSIIKRELIIRITRMSITVNLLRRNNIVTLQQYFAENDRKERNDCKNLLRVLKIELQYICGCENLWHVVFKLPAIEAIKLQFICNKIRKLHLYGVHSFYSFMKHWKCNVRCRPLNSGHLNNMERGKRHKSGFCKGT